MSKIRKIFSEAWPTLRQTVRRYPVELALSLYAFVCFLLEKLDVLSHTWAERLLWGLPIAFATTYIVNTLTRGGSRRRLYPFAWLVLVPAVWVGSELFSTSQHVIADTILVPLALLLCRRATDNRRFVEQASGLLTAWILAPLFAGIFFLTVEAIFTSVNYIFDIWDHALSDIWAYNCIFSFSLLAPTLFLTLLDHFDRTRPEIDRLGAGLLNYLLTPALLIYTVILYLYAARILFVRELPKGGVAYMVFGYMTALTVIMALQELLRERRYDGFFRRYSLLSAVPLVLFWLGAMHRIGEYGLTEWRVYLLVCGLICTVSALLFARPRTGRYRGAALAAFVLFLVVAFLPPLTADRIGIRSQSRRAERIARERGMLLPDGRIDLTTRAEADSIHIGDYHQLGEALEYLADRDTLALARFGIRNLDTYYEIFPRSYSDRVRYDWLTYDPVAVEEAVDADILLAADADTRIPSAGYRTLYPNADRDDRSDTVVLRFGKRRAEIDRNALLAAQMERAGLKWEDNPSAEDFRKAKEQFLFYENDTLGIVFKTLYIDPRERRISALHVENVLSR